MIRALAYTSALFLVSGLILLLVDSLIYKIQHMDKERTLARILGWTQLSLAGASFLAYLLLEL
ncbi:CLC_0170 family protein [Paenibacillus phocaensis]|uniref:CLC_0170 family protein n=1 Tax=Paenibacillus phocaensis TaxID=1776378 RepID=UPI0003AAE3D5|nr:CLC_0170 family protein [Paenibacillus phocaensis]